MGSVIDKSRASQALPRGCFKPPQPVVPAGGVINYPAGCCCEGGAGGVRAARYELSERAIEYTVTELAVVTELASPNWHEFARSLVTP